MRITIHRGLNQIGGCITEISTTTSRVFIDMGQNLPGNGKPTTEEQDRAMVYTLFANNMRDNEAVFYTHIHEDHIGLFYHVPDDVPQYLGEGAKKLFKKKYELILEGQRLNENTDVDVIANTLMKIARIEQMKTWERAKPKNNPAAIAIGDIKITPFFCSHSVYDSYMFLIEAEDKRVWHTGDYREHGYLGKGLFPVLKKYAKKIDLLITEGTMLARNVEEVLHEAELIPRVKNQLDVYPYVFILISATDWERIVTIKDAVKLSGRKIYVSGKFLKEAFAIMSARERRYWRGILQQEPEIFSNGFASKIKSGCCILCGAGHYDRVDKWKQNFEEDKTLLIYSAWDGYYKDPEQVKLNPAYKQFYDSFKHCVDIHTSGHASCETIEQVINAVRPRRGVVCIHKDENTSLESLKIDGVYVINENVIEL